MRKSFYRLLALLSLSLYISTAAAQSTPNSFDRSFKKEAKPFKILTSGKQVTLKSTKEIKTIMVWTASGHRIVEQTQVNASSFNFNVSGSRERIFFVMIQYEGQKPVTERFGVE
jgi:hypothetical protein